jgi:hypothetical protein
VYPFNVKTMKKRVVDAEDGVATIDWVVLLAALTSVGVALVDVTSEPLGIHARDVRGELQDNVFETAWADNVPVGPSGEGMPDVLQAAMNPGGSTPWRWHAGWRHAGWWYAPPESRSGPQPRSGPDPGP